jgi:dihydrofolate synthase/folylpolyglutamate synthase
VDAAQVLLEKAKEVGVPFRFEGVEFGVESRTVAVGGQMVTIQGLADRYEDLLVPLHGAHQAENAAVAVAALEAFFGADKPLNPEVLQEAFAAVTSPGRLEVLRTAPTIVVDAAHNPEGIRVSAEALQEAFSFSKLVVVLGILQEKDAEEILRQLKDSLEDVPAEFCFTQSNSPRAIPAEELGELALDLGFGEDVVHTAEKLDDALEWAVERAESNDDLAGGILVTGSITLVAEARILLGKSEA